MLAGCVLIVGSVLAVVMYGEFFDDPNIDAEKTTQENITEPLSDNVNAVISDTDEIKTKGEQ